MGKSKNKNASFFKFFYQIPSKYAIYHLLHEKRLYDMFDNMAYFH